MCFGVLGYILRFGKVKKNSVDTQFTRTYYRMKIGGFDGVMGECAGILKKCYFDFGFGFGVCG